MARSTKSSTKSTNRYAHTPAGTVVTFRRNGKLYRAEVGLFGKLVGKRQVQA